MKSCVTCFYQGDNSVDVNGEGKVFCMLNCKWKKEQDSCPKFVEYADLSKELRAQYALNESSGNRNISSLIKTNWYLILTTFIISFILFLIVVKFFDKYIF